MPDQLQRVIPISILIGLSAGLLAGVFGVGGGFIMVPLFVTWLLLDQKTAHATSLVAIVFIAIAALGGYIHTGSVRFDYALFIFIGGLFGTFIGVKVFQKIAPSLLRNIFAVTLVLVALRLLWSDTPHQLFSGTLATLVLILTGIVAGVLSGLLGVGGGIVIVPALILCSGIQPEVARGTSLVVIIGTAMLGSFLHHKSGQINYQVAITAGLAGMPAAFGASFIGAAASNRVILTLFSGLLIAIAVQLALFKRG